MQDNILRKPKSISLKSKSFDNKLVLFINSEKEKILFFILQLHDICESFILYLRGINWTGDITLPTNTEESVFSIVVESGKNYINGIFGHTEISSV